MKKILTTIAGAFVAAGVFAQGTLYTLNSGSGVLVSTNGASYSQGTGVTAGTGFIYALMENNSATVTGGNVSGLLSDTDPLSANWTFSGVYMTNINGGVLSGGISVADPMWAFNTTNAYFVIGWSVNFGTTWGQISNALAGAAASGGNWTQQGYFGTSTVGWGQPGGGSPALPVYHIFGTASSAQGTPVAGFTLYAVPVPEPATMALGALGGLSLLLFRRRK